VRPRAGLLIQKLDRRFTISTGGENTTTARQEFFECWETNNRGNDVDLPHTNPGPPLDQFASLFEKSGDCRFEGTLYFVASTDNNFAAINRLFKKNTPRVPPEISMRTALDVPRDVLGEPIGHRILSFKSTGTRGQLQASLKVSVATHPDGHHDEIPVENVDDRYSASSSHELSTAASSADHGEQAGIPADDDDAFGDFQSAPQ